MQWPRKLELPDWAYDMQTMLFPSMVVDISAAKFNVACAITTEVAVSLYW